MKAGNPYWRVLRLSWPVLGGVWGAWVGFGGFSGLAHNPDSFGSWLAGGFFVASGLAGLLAGAACGALIGSVVAFAMQRCGAGVASASIVATVINAGVLWQLAERVLVEYPGLRAEAPGTAPPARHRDPGAAGRLPSASPQSGAPSRSSCSDPPPTQPRDRSSWDTECR